MSFPKAIASKMLYEVAETHDKSKADDFIDLISEYLQSFEFDRTRIDLNHTRIGEQESSLKELIQIVQNGFDRMDKRFEAVDKRFEAVEKRFEAVDKRFDDLIHQMDKRFEAVDRRFDDMNKKFNLLTWFIAFVFLVMNITIVLLKFFS